MWSAILNVILGIWVMIAPGILGFEENAANNNYIIGPVIVTAAITAIWEVNRSARYINIVLGAWLAVSVFFIDAGSNTAMINNIIIGILITCLSFIRGKINGRYGGGWIALFQDKPVHIRESEL